MNICICDDEKIEREFIRKLCKEFFQSKKLSYDIWEADSAAKVLERKVLIDLLILDIEMPGMDGVSLKNQLQRDDKQILVLFVTGHDEMMVEAFGVNVIGFIGKEWLKIKLPRYLGLAITLAGRNIMVDGKYRSQEIVKIHSEKEYCNLFFKDGTTELMRGSLKNLGEELHDFGFARINRSWIANLCYVKRIDRWDILVNGEAYTVTRKYREAFEEMYENFCEKNARYF